MSGLSTKFAGQRADSLADGGGLGLVLLTPQHMMVMMGYAPQLHW